MVAKRNPTLRAHAAQVAQNNPLKTAATVVITLGVLAGAFVAVDDRYAHAGDFARQTQLLSGQLEVNRLTAEVSVLQIRKSQLQDKVDDAATKRAVQRRLSPPEEVGLQRYSTELSDTTRQIAEKQQLIDKLRTGK